MPNTLIDFKLVRSKLVPPPQLLMHAGRASIHSTFPNPLLVRWFRS